MSRHESAVRLRHMLDHAREAVAMAAGKTRDDPDNELRGGMDASQYKDYVLVLLFVKYVSDKSASDAKALIEAPQAVAKLREFAQLI